MKQHGKKRSVREIITSTICEYFVETTVHGFKYIAEGRNVFEKGFWGILIISMFIISGRIILTSLNDWAVTPLQTTIDKVSVPVQDFSFPAITLYDQETLQMPRRNRWMYLESLLNMIDIYSIHNEDKVGNEALEPQEMDFLSLKNIRSEVDNLLETHYRSFEFYGGTSHSADVLPRLQRKDCWNSKLMTSEKTCTVILEFLYVSKEENIKKITVDILRKTFQSWHRHFPLPPKQKFVKKWGFYKLVVENQVDPYSIMKDKIFPIYKEFYSQNHTDLKNAFSSNDSFLDLGGETACYNSTRCLGVLDVLIEMWQKLSNAINVPLSKDLGTIIANFNFLMEDYQGSLFNFYRNSPKFAGFHETNIKSMHGQITQITSHLLPDLQHENMTSFVDILGLLGFETTFGFEQWSGKDGNYHEVSSILYPHFGLDDCNDDTSTSSSCFDEERKTTCGLWETYCEWVYYLCWIETTNGTETDNDQDMNDMNSTAENGTYLM